MSLFRLDASIREEGSASRALADIVEDHWRAATFEPSVTRRHIGRMPLPSEAWSSVISALGVPEDQRSESQRQAAGLAASLVDELEEAREYIFAVPLYNFGVSQHFKTYVDLATADPRMTPEAATATAGKSGVLVTVQGGNYSPGTPKEGWDHATAWMRRILEDVWGIDLKIISREFTLVGENPALDSFTDMAAEIRADAEHQAREYGRTLAAQRQTV